MQKQRPLVAEIDEESTDKARLLALEKLVLNQQQQIEELKTALALAQKSTPYKARIAFEAEVRGRLRELKQSEMTPLKARLAFEKDIGIRVEKIESAKLVTKSDMEVVSKRFKSLDKLLAELRDRCESIRDDVYGEEQETRRNVDALKERIYTIELRFIQQWVDQNPESHWRLLEEVQSWGISLTELERDADELARWISPQYFCSIFLRRIYCSEREARSAYVRKSSQLARYPAILDLLWRYGILLEMLKEAPIKRGSRRHIQYGEMIAEYFQRVGVTRAVETSQAQRPRLPQSVVLTRAQESNDGDY
jgi:hypothetical protein